MATQQEDRSLKHPNPSYPNQHDTPSGKTTDMIVRNPFTLTRQNGERVNYVAGKHTGIPVEDADHFWTKLHLQPENEPAAETATAPASDQDIAARAAMQDEVARLKVLLSNGETARQALVAERDGLRAELDTAQALVAEQASEIERLKAELEADDAETETAKAQGEVGIYRKGRRWFVHRGAEKLGEYGSKDEAEAKAAEVRGAATQAA